MIDSAEMTPCGAMFDIFKRYAHITHLDLCGLILSDRPLSDGRSAASRASDRSWVSRFIVRAPIGSLQDRYFCDYGVAADRIFSHLKLRRRNAMTNEDIQELVCGAQGRLMDRALENSHLDVHLYHNALERLSGAPELTASERAKTVLVLLVAVGCSGDVRRAVDYTLGYTHAECGGATSTPLHIEVAGASAAGAGMAAEAEQATPEANPLGLLRIEDGYVMSEPYWIEPACGGICIGALSTGEGDITDVGADVSSRHARIWCDGDHVWHVEDLGSTNGTVLLDGATGERRGCESGHPQPLAPGDELRLGTSTTFMILMGPAIR